MTEKISQALAEHSSATNVIAEQVKKVVQVAEETNYSADQTRQVSGFAAWVGRYHAQGGDRVPGEMTPHLRLRWGAGIYLCPRHLDRAARSCA